MPAPDCSWHLHLDFADGGRDCRTGIATRRDAETAVLWAEQTRAAERYRLVVRHQAVPCAEDRCARTASRAA